MYIAFRWRIRNTGNQRSWTETWLRFFVETDIRSPTVAALVRAYAAVRAGALSSGNMLVDATIFDPADPSHTVIITINSPGNIPGVAVGSRDPAQDVAPVALLVALTSAVRTRNYLMRGIPDSAFVSGEYQPGVLQGVAINRWLDTIKTNTFQITRYTANALTPPGLINTVTASGITLRSPLTVPIDAHTLLAVKTQVSGGGRSITTRVRLLADVAVGDLILPVAWANGNCSDGLVRTLARGADTILSYAIRSAARTRKTGGPLGKFRGRR